MDWRLYQNIRNFFESFLFYSPYPLLTLALRDCFIIYIAFIKMKFQARFKSITKLNFKDDLPLRSRFSSISYTICLYFVNIFVASKLFSWLVSIVTSLRYFNQRNFMLGKFCNHIAVDWSWLVIFILEVDKKVLSGWSTTSYLPRLCGVFVWARHIKQVNNQVKFTTWSVIIVP